MLFGREPTDRNDDPDYETRPGLLKRGFRWFVVALVVLLGGGLAVWVVTGPPPSSPPVIAGSNLPDRRAPGDQSGLVPNQDQPIYERVSPGSETDRGQELLKEPERPMNQASVADQAKAQDQALAAGSTGGGQAPAADRPDTLQPGTPPVTKNAIQSPPLSIPKIPLDTTPVQPRAEEYRIQIASVRTPEIAESEWNRISRRHPDLLSQLTPTFGRFETATNGTYFRVQGGPLADKALADLLCAQLVARKVDCIVISP